jgi:hypothetical protein
MNDNSFKEEETIATLILFASSLSIVSCFIVIISYSLFKTL